MQFYKFLDQIVNGLGVTRFDTDTNLHKPLENTQAFSEYIFLKYIIGFLIKFRNAIGVKKQERAPEGGAQSSAGTSSTRKTADDHTAGTWRLWDAVHDHIGHTAPPWPAGIYLEIGIDFFYICYVYPFSQRFGTQPKKVYSSFCHNMQ